MTNASDLTARTLSRLTAEASPERDTLIALAIDHALDTTLRQAVSAEQVRALVMRGLSEVNIARVLQRHVKPGFVRYGAAIASSVARVGSLVPADGEQRIVDVVRKLKPPKARWLQGAVDPVLVRKLLAPVWMHVLLSFAKRLPIPGLGGSASAGGGGGGGDRGPSLTGMLARSVGGQAGKLLDRGKSVMGGLGIDVDRLLTDAARSFSDNAAEVFRDAWRERMRSDEGRALMGQILSGVVSHVMRAKFADIQHDVVDDLPIDAVFELTPSVVAHAAPSRYVQDIVQRELDAYLALEGDRTLRSLLDELGMLAETRALLLADAGKMTASVLRTPQFATWLQQLLAQ